VSTDRQDTLTQWVVAAFGAIVLAIALASASTAWNKLEDNTKRITAMEIAMARNGAEHEAMLAGLGRIETVLKEEKKVGTR
jgi:hypothetical protein